MNPVLHWHGTLPTRKTSIQADEQMPLLIRYCSQSQVMAHARRSAFGSRHGSEGINLSDKVQKIQINFGLNQ